MMVCVPSAKLEGEALRKALFSLVLISALVSLAWTEAKHDFQQGKLVNIASDERLVDGTTFRRAIYTVETGGVIYSARGERLRRRSGDPGHGLIIGDPVQVAIEGDSLILLRPDGKEMKTKIVKREREH
jgi:hypothetical protein